jgi:hypothetical protein
VAVIFPVGVVVWVTEATLKERDYKLAERDGITPRYGPNRPMKTAPAGGRQEDGQPVRVALTHSLEQP